MFRKDSNTTTQKDEQQNCINEEIKAEIKGFFATDNLNTETKEVLNWFNFKNSKYPHLASFARTAPSSSVFSERLFSEAGICMSKGVIDCFQKPVKNLFLHHNLKNVE